MIRRILTLPVLRAGAPLFAATLLWQLSNFVFNAAGARLLGPVSYGSLAAAVGLLYLLNPLLLTIQTVASRETTAYVSTDRAPDIRAAMWFYGRRLGVAGLVTCLAIVIASPWISDFLKIGTPAPVVVLAAAVPLWCIASLLRGIFQGSQHFGRLAISTAVEAIAKISSAIVILSLFWRGATGGMIAVVIGAAGALLVSSLMASYLPYTENHRTPTVHPGRYTLITLAALGLLAILLSTDTLAAKHYLSPADAGLYAGVSICGKIVYFVTSVLAIYLFPIFSAQHDRGRDARGGLGLSLAFVLGGSIIFAGLFSVEPQLVVTPLLGSKYAAACQYVGLAGIAFGLYGCVYLSAMYLLARRQSAVIAILGVSVALFLFLLYQSHSSISQLLHVLIIVFSCTGAALVAWAMLSSSAAARVVSVDSDRAKEPITAARVSE
jgi:O-antigen/teichoic acid export membrane protein